MRADLGGAEWSAIRRRIGTIQPHSLPILRDRDSGYHVPNELKLIPRWE